MEESEPPINLFGDRKDSEMHHEVLGTHRGYRCLPSNRSTENYFHDPCGNISNFTKMFNIIFSSQSLEKHKTKC